MPTKTNTHNMFMMALSSLIVCDYRFKIWPSLFGDDTKSGQIVIYHYSASATCGLASAKFTNGLLQLLQDVHSAAEAKPTQFGSQIFLMFLGL